MSWSVMISLKSKKYKEINKLKNILQRDALGTDEEIDDFSKFHLPTGSKLIFNGDRDIFSVNSSDIEYLDFNRDD